MRLASADKERQIGIDGCDNGCVTGGTLGGRARQWARGKETEKEVNEKRTAINKTQVIGITDKRTMQLVKKRIIHRQSSPTISSHVIGKLCMNRLDD